MENLLENPKFKERWAMYEAALQTGLPIVSRETCAIICALLVVWGNTEEFTHNHRLTCELLYAQKRFRVEGSLTPDGDFGVLLRHYITQLELVQQREDRVPEYIDRMMQSRYGFHFNNTKK